MCLHFGCLEHFCGGNEFSTKALEDFGAEEIRIRLSAESNSHDFDCLETHKKLRTSNQERKKHTHSLGKKQSLGDVFLEMFFVGCLQKFQETSLKLNLMVGSELLQIDS